MAIAIHSGAARCALHRHPVWGAANGQISAFSGSPRQHLRYLQAGRLAYWRTRGGAEVDFIIETPHEFIPIEVKWTDNPRLGELRGLLAFLAEHRQKAKRGYVVCRCRHPLQLHPQIMAFPWWRL